MTQEETKKEETKNQKNLENIAKESEIKDTPIDTSGYRYHSSTSPEEREDHSIPSSNYYYSNNYNPNAHYEGGMDGQG